LPGCLSDSHLLHGNFNAPIEEALEEGIRVLDAGCGSGMWTLEMAEDYPNSTFIGTDILELYPKIEEIPSNCTFLKADTLKGLPFDDDAFDYVFQRQLSPAFTPQDWPVAIRELVRVIKPGGWIETLEFSADLERPPETDNYMELVRPIFIQLHGFDFRYVKNISKLLADNELINTDTDYISLPLNWGGRIGALYGKHMRRVLSALETKCAQALNLNSEEYSQLIENYLKRCRENKSWTKVWYTYAMKAPN